MPALEGRAGNDHITGEQAALRRVATLVARGAAPDEVFSAIAEEAGRLLGADFATMIRYDPDGAATVVAFWDSTGTAFRVGAQLRLGGQNVPTLVYQTGRAARIDDHSGTSGLIADLGLSFGCRAAIGVPVSVEGGLWGVTFVGSRDKPLPAGTEARLAGFTELAGTAIANAQARVQLRGFAEEQAALRRVATLVARAARPEEVFAAVTEEAGRLLHADYATMCRYDPDGVVFVVANWSPAGAALPVGAKQRLGGKNLHTMIFQTGRAARIDDYATASGPVADEHRELGLHAGAGVPVSVEDHLWGVMIVASRSSEPLPAGTETRLAGFTELAATAIANAEAQVALAASRARIVATADATRRRIERNLHDGAQQHLVSLALELRTAQAAPPAPGELVPWLDGITDELAGVLEELREIAHGLHPGVLAQGGLRPALKALAARSPVSARLDVQVEGRLPEPVETAAYYTVAEALTNAAKHAHATTAEIQVTADDRSLYLRIRDDGRGGADFTHGTGLLGLKDRVEALSGHLLLHSPPGAGTTLDITLPIDDHRGPKVRPGTADIPEQTSRSRTPAAGDRTITPLRTQRPLHRSAFRVYACLGATPGAAVTARQFRLDGGMTR